MSQAACLPDLTQIMIKDAVTALATACNIQLIPGFEFSALKHILNECSNMGIPLFGSILPVERPLTSVEITTALGDWCILVQQETKVSAEPSQMSAASGTVVELTKSIREESSEKIAQSAANTMQLPKSVIASLLTKEMTAYMQSVTALSPTQVVHLFQKGQLHPFVAQAILKGHNEISVSSLKALNTFKRPVLAALFGGCGTTFEFSVAPEFPSTIFEEAVQKLVVGQIAAINFPALASYMTDGSVGTCMTQSTRNDTAVDQTLGKTAEDRVRSLELLRIMWSRINPWDKTTPDTLTKFKGLLQKCKDETLNDLTTSSLLMVIIQSVGNKCDLKAAAPHFGDAELVIWTPVANGDDIVLGEPKVGFRATALASTPNLIELDTRIQQQKTVTKSVKRQLDAFATLPNPNLNTRAIQQRGAKRPASTQQTYNGNKNTNRPYQQVQWIDARPAILSNDYRVRYGNLSHASRLKFDAELNVIAQDLRLRRNERLCAQGCLLPRNGCKCNARHVTNEWPPHFRATVWAKLGIVKIKQ